MAATAQSIVSSEVALKYPALDNRMLLVCLCGVYAAGTGLTAQAALNGATALGYAAMSNQQLDECLLQALS